MSMIGMASNKKLKETRYFGELNTISSYINDISILLIKQMINLLNVHMYTFVHMYIRHIYTYTHNLFCIGFIKVFFLIF